jgi:asparagine synthase (glutamine-hydrolysing)
MCGICGIWGHPDPEKVEKMVTALHHRGPDDSGVYHGEVASLGMARLAVIDINPTGHQPMSNPGQTIWIVYNGEVYNFQEQRQHLEKMGHRFVSTSDTEVILRLYEQYGDDFLLRLRGMFALAIYDIRRGHGRERLLLARDHLGIKPLLYAEIGNQLIFASEIKALLASGLIKREVDHDSLRLLLTFGSIYQPKTILRDVKMLLPGHRLIIENGKLRVERYWSLGVGRKPEAGKLPYEEQVEVMREALQESVRLQMVSDVPLGAFLSGGVDSSITVAMMSALAGHRIKTFSVGFEQEGSHIDETEEARKTAEFLGTDHHHVIVQGTDVRDRILHIASGLDQPTVDGVNSYFVSMAARQHVTVAISGTGGDELFAGYPWYINMVREAGNPANLRTNAIAAFARLPIFDPIISTRWNHKLHQARTSAGFLSRYAMQYHIFGSLHTMLLLDPQIKQDAQAGRSEAADLKAIDELATGSVLERVTALCLRGYTANQLLRDIDSASMAHTLEVRVPYLDTELADLALSLPDESKLVSSRIKGGDIMVNTYRALGAKRILIDVGRPMLPKDFDLQPKRGFGMPFDVWLRGPLKEIMMDTLSESTLRKRGWFSPEQARTVLGNFESQAAGWTHPWLLMMTELWAREVLDR